MRLFLGWCALWLSACAPSTAPHPGAGAPAADNATRQHSAVSKAGASAVTASSVTTSAVTASSVTTSAPRRSSAAAPSAAPPPPPGDPARAPAASLPPGILPGQVVKLRVPQDRTLLVVHAPANVRLAALYLHGVCGDIDAIRSWAEVASRHATLIALLADEPCADGARYRWTANTSHQERRIGAALSAVKDARGGLLDTERRLLIGYSQGALRALALRAAYPERYPRLLLGGLPTQPPSARVRGVERIALLAGALEGKAQVESTLKAWSADKISAQLFILPRAGHGQYGPEAPRVMEESLSWLLDGTGAATAL